MTTLEGSDAEMTEADVPISPFSFPNSRYPTGWFQVAWSDDIPPGTVKLVKYFGTGIVLWRGESGELYATDEHCLHLGASLGVNGRVEGEEIVCPWHSWHWNGEGRNTLIPYSTQSCKRNLQLKVWPAHDWYGAIIVWHDAGHSEPTWQPPAIEALDGDFYPVDPARRYRSRIKAHPQMAVENGGDPADVMYIHGAGEMPRYVDISVDGALWSADVSLTYGAERDSTWLTPNGPIETTVGFMNWGLGLGATIWPAELMSARMLISHTPIDDEYCDQYFWMTCERRSQDAEAPAALDRFFKHQKATNEQDYFTWENMKILPRPNFTPEEARPMASLRRWAWQFYPHLRQPVSGQENGDASA